MRTYCLTVAAVLLSASVAFAAQKPFDVDTLLRTRIIADMQAAPTGDFAVVRLTDYDGGDKFLSDYVQVWANGTVVPLTSGGKHKGSFAISPDGQSLAFAGERDGKGGIYVLPLTGGEARLLKEIPVDPDNLRWTLGGIFFTAMVLPECGADLECTKKRLEERKKTTSALVYDQLLHRPWNAWRNGTYANLFVLDPEARRVDPVILGPVDVPQFPLGGREGYTVSDDGKLVAVSVKIDPSPARSTNYDVYEIARGADGRWSAPKRLSQSPGADEGPQISPDGTKIAFLSQDTAGFESDLWRLRVIERKTGAISSYTDRLDRWVTAFAWAPDSKRIFFALESAGYRPLYSVSLVKGRTEEEMPRTVVRMLSSSHKFLWYTREAMDSPPELYIMEMKSGAHRRVAGFNADTAGAAAFGKLEEVWYDSGKGPDGRPRKVHSFLIMPPNPPTGKKVPLLVFIHGGPQGATMDGWHVRWHPMVFASMGFAVAAPNFTGSTGFGQAFTNAISKDWGGAPYEDVMMLLDHLAKDPRIDAQNACAIGGSYGGYMTNWIEGHTDRFKCLVSHASVFNLASKYGTTDELWFPEWEFGGAPWTNPQAYEKWSPHNYVKSFRTPIMVTHGANDFRVPLEQGLGMYQYAKVMGVEAKLVVFPDEDHFVNKPKNRRFWYETVGAWLKAHTGMK